MDIEKPDIFNIVPSKVLVLMGGWSSEREISLKQGNDVAMALTSVGHEVASLDPPRDTEQLVHKIVHSFNDHPPDVIFNVLLGRWGEDGIFQGIFELLDIPYTNSGVLSSALGNNKRFTNQIVRLNGVTCPEEFIVTQREFKNIKRDFPYILKPISEGASIGVTKISSLHDQERAAANWIYGNEMIVQEYVPGREITVLVFNGKATGALETLVDGDEVYDTSHKTGEKDVKYVIPASLPAEDYEHALKMAEMAHKTLGCSGMTRSDFRYNDKSYSSSEGNNRLFFLEINTQPGIYRESYAAAIMAHLGWSYEELLQWMIQDALKD